MATRSTAKATITITDPNKLYPSKANPPEVKQDTLSATISPVQETKSRATPVSEPTSTWTTLDIGGMRVRNLSPSLFQFSYITTLFLNHNLLSNIPPQIERLRALVLLDLSGNQLMNIPPELGMLTRLRELYLFDNHIITVPPELGTLHQLEMLGIEGNPIETSIRRIVEKDGTQALIAHL